MTLLWLKQCWVLRLLNEQCSLLIAQSAINIFVFHGSTTVLLHICTFGFCISILLKCISIDFKIIFVSNTNAMQFMCICKSSVQYTGVNSSADLMYWSVVEPADLIMQNRGRAGRWSYCMLINPKPLTLLDEDQSEKQNWGKLPYIRWFLWQMVFFHHFHHRHRHHLRLKESIIGGAISIPTGRQGCASDRSHMGRFPACCSTWKVFS